VRVADERPCRVLILKAALLPEEQRKRWLDINKRYRAVREREAKVGTTRFPNPDRQHASNVPSLLQLHPSLSQNLRAEIGPLQQRLRAVRTELDNITRAKREQEERARRMKEEQERREREAKRIDDLKRGQGIATASQPNSRPGSGPSTPGAQIAAAGSSANAAKPAQPPVVVNLAL
jgi:TolA-binding protein